MRRILTIAFALGMIASTANATESPEDRACNAKFAAAARYLTSASPEWKAIVHHSIDLNNKYPEDWTDDKVQDSKTRHRQDMDFSLGQIKGGQITIEQVFADVNVCETRLGWPVTPLKVGRQPTD